MKYIKNGIIFHWDSRKAAANILKHGITFETACEVFFDPYCRLLDVTDDDHPDIRDHLVGYTESGKMLYVVHIEQSDEAYRIISARIATAQERDLYRGA